MDLELNSQEAGLGRKLTEDNFVTSWLRMILGGLRWSLCLAKLALVVLDEQPDGKCPKPLKI